MRQTQSVVRASSLPIPKLITESVFHELCLTFRISEKWRPFLRERLDALVTEFAQLMREEKRQPDRRQDRERILSVRRHLKEVESDIQNLGPAGRYAHILITPYIARMLSWTWLAKKVPLGSHIQPLGDVNDAGSEFDARDFLVERHAGEVMCAILTQLRTGYERVLADFSRGGRQPLHHRRFLIINLACFWEAMNRLVSTGPKSDFVACAEQVVEAIGWPPDGVAAEVPKAIGYWRNRAKY
jgi:hypothetical protein